MYISVFVKGKIMKSIAIWCNKKDKNILVSADIHFNFWKVKRKKKFSNYNKKYCYLLDIGILIYNIKNINSIKLFFPLEIKKSDINDLGKIIRNKNLLNGIFNEDFKILYDSNPKQTKVIGTDNNLRFIIYNIDDTVQIENKFDGTILNIDVNNINNIPDPIYIRFRISSGNLIKLIKHLQPKTSFFQHAFTCTEVIDFRLNEKRTYNESLSEIINTDGELEIKKVHFLLLRDEKDDFESVGISPNCRELEPQVWDDYIGNAYENNNIVAYHWSVKSSDTKPKIDSFNSLIKVKTYKSSLNTILIYLAILAITTICFNLLSNGMQTLINSICK